MVIISGNDDSMVENVLVLNIFTKYLAHVIYIQVKSQKMSCDFAPLAFYFIFFFSYMDVLCFLKI